MGCGVSVEGERETSEDCCALEERVKERVVACEQGEARGCSAAEWVANSGEEGVKATCKNRTLRVLTGLVGKDTCWRLASTLRLCDCLFL